KLLDGDVVAGLQTGSRVGGRIRRRDVLARPGLHVASRAEHHEHSLPLFLPRRRLTVARDVDIHDLKAALRRRQADLDGPSRHVAIISQLADDRREPLEVLARAAVIRRQTVQHRERADLRYLRGRRVRRGLLALFGDGLRIRRRSRLLAACGEQWKHEYDCGKREAHQCERWGLAPGGRREVGATAPMLCPHPIWCNRERGPGDASAYWRSTRMRTSTVSPRSETARITCSPGTRASRSLACARPSTDHRMWFAPAARSGMVAYRDSSPAGTQYRSPSAGDVTRNR